MDLSGFEPLTSRLSRRALSQLSYSPSRFPQEPKSRWSRTTDVSAYQACALTI